MNTYTDGPADGVDKISIEIMEDIINKSKIGDINNIQLNKETLEKFIKKFNIVEEISSSVTTLYGLKVYMFKNIPLNEIHMYDNKGNLIKIFELKE